MCQGCQVIRDWSTPWARKKKPICRAEFFGGRLFRFQIFFIVCDWHTIVVLQKHKLTNHKSQPTYTILCHPSVEALESPPRAGLVDTRHE